jgi:hypothetical protein
VSASKGVTCAAMEHFLCAACVESLVIDSIQPGNDGTGAKLTRLSDGRIHCPHCLGLQPRVVCDYGDAQLGKVLPATVFDQYLHVRMRLLEDRKSFELEAEMQNKIAQELVRLRMRDEVQRKVMGARKYIEEELLQTKCPSCRAVFFDFEGCFALKCARCPCVHVCIHVCTYACKVLSCVTVICYFVWCFLLAWLWM